MAGPIGPHRITERERQRDFISNADVRIKAGLELPEEINPFSTQNTAIIESALAANPVLAKYPEARHKLMAPIQAGMARIALSRFGRGANVADEINYFQGVLSSLANNTGGGIAGDIVNLARAVANIDPAILAEEAKRRGEQNRKMQEEAMQIAQALAAKNNKKPINWFGNERFGALSDLDPHTYFKVMAYLKKKAAIASGNPALLAAAGIFYSAAYEGDYSASASSRSSDYVMASTRTSPTQYMSFSTPWQSTIEREIQRQEWRTNPPPPYVPQWEKPSEEPPKTPEQSAAIDRFLQENPEYVRGSGNTVYKPGEGEALVDEKGNITLKTKDQVAAELKQKEEAEVKAATQGGRRLSNGNTKFEDGTEIDATGKDVIDSQRAKQLEAEALPIAQARVVADEIARKAIREGKTREEVAKDPAGVEIHADGKKLTEEQGGEHRREKEKKLDILGDMIKKRKLDDQQRISAGLPLERPSMFDRRDNTLRFLLSFAKGTKAEEGIRSLIGVVPKNAMEEAALNQAVASYMNMATGKVMRELPAMFDPQLLGETPEQTKARLASETPEQTKARLELERVRAVTGASWASSLNPFDSRTPKQRAIEAPANSQSQPVYDQLGTMTGFIAEPTTPEQGVAPDNTAVVKPRSLLDRIRGIPETPDQKQARELAALEADVAKAKAAAKPSWYASVMGEKPEAKQKREADAAVALAKAEDALRSSQKPLESAIKPEAGAVVPTAGAAQRLVADVVTPTAVAVDPAKKMVELQAALAKAEATAAAPQTMDQRFIESKKAQEERLAANAAAVVEARKAIERATTPVVQAPIAEVAPPAAVTGVTGTGVAPVDKGKGVVVDGAPGEERTEAYIKSSRKYAGLHSPKSTLGAIGRHGRPIAQTVGRVGGANDPVPEAVTAPRGTGDQVTAAEPKKPNAGETAEPAKSGNGSEPPKPTIVATAASKPEAATGEAAAAKAAAAQTEEPAKKVASGGRLAGPV